RVPVLLCDLEGRSRKEVACRLGIPEGTLSSRLATARQMLARRLRRHAPTLSGAALALVLAKKMAAAGGAAPPAGFTLTASPAVAAGQTLAGAVAARVASLTEGVLHAMLFTRLKVTTAVLLALTCAALGLGVAVYPTVAAQQPEVRVTNVPPQEA